MPVCCKISIVCRSVNLSTTLEDVSFIFQRHNGYIRLNTSPIVDAIYTHDGCYLGILKETKTTHSIEMLSKLLYILVLATLIMYMIATKKY